MKTFEKFYKIFGNKESFLKECEDLNKNLLDKNILKNYSEIKEILNKWDKNLFIKKQNYEMLLNELFQKEQLMNFIKDKTEEDIRNLRELIDPVQSQFITNDDINELEDLIKLKDQLKEKANSDNFFQDLSSFISRTYKNESEISKVVRKIKNISDKILDLIEIYNKKLDKNVYAEKKFESISKSGIFDIIFNGKIYICSVISDKYKDEKKEDNNEENKNKKNIIKVEEKKKQRKYY